MRIGLAFIATDLSMDPVELAREAEGRGFASLFLSEHTHIPVSRETPPPTGDEVLGEEYKRMLDPVVAIASAAAVTSKIRFGTGVALPAQHDAILFAKQVATLDRLSKGRLTLGIGYGWNREEMADHGVAYEERRTIVRETMLAMQSLWQDEVASFQGEFVQLSPSWAWPKPVQQPRPPVLLGGAAGPKLFQHIVEYGDGWIPIGGAGVRGAIAELKDGFAKADRDPETLQVVPMGVLPTREKLDAYRRIPVTEVLLRLPSASRDEVMRTLDEYTAFL